MVIPREARRITYSTKIRELKSLPLTEHQKAVLIGSVLGDAYLEPNWSKTNYRLNIRQSITQKDYVQWKYGVFENLVLTPPQQYDQTKCVWFRTISHSEITDLHQMLYRDGKKIIPQNIAELISNPVTLAVWFMDDGNLAMRRGKVYGYHLNTQSFTKEENERLAHTLETLYGIHCTVEKNKKYYRLAIWRETSRIMFVSLVEKYILSSMTYKIG